MLVVALISIDAYPFFWLSQTWPVTLKIQELVFSGCTVPPDSKETQIEAATKKIFHQLVKILGHF